MQDGAIPWRSANISDDGELLRLEYALLAKCAGPCLDQRVVPLATALQDAKQTWRITVSASAPHGSFRVSFVANQHLARKASDTLGPNPHNLIDDFFPNLQLTQ